MGSPAHGEAGARAAAADARGTRGGILQKAERHACKYRALMEFPPNAAGGLPAAPTNRTFAAAARSSALLTIRGLASFLALFVVTQYTSKLGLRAGISLGTLATALGFLFYAIAGKSYLLYCVPQINETSRRAREVFWGEDIAGNSSQTV